MNEARVDRIEEALGGIADKVERVDVRLDGVERRLDAKIDGVEQRLDAKIEAGFLEVQVAFDEQRRFAEFLVERSEQRIREEMREGFGLINSRFDRLEERLFNGRP